MPNTTLDDDIKQLEFLQDSILLQDNVINCISTHGVSKSSFLIMKSANLLTSTSLDFVSLESLDSSHNEIALESLLDKAKEKIATWSAKVLSFTKSAQLKITNLFNPLLNKLKEYSKKVIDKVFSKADGAKKYVKAHPYKTIAAAILAVLAVIGVGQFIIRGFPLFRNASRIPQFMSTVGRMISKIKYPLGKIATSYSKGGTVLKVTIASGGFITGAGTIAALGWTKDKVANLYREYSQIKVNSETLTSGSSNLIKNVATDGIAFVKGVYQGSMKGFDSGYYAAADEGGVRQVGSSVVGMTITTFAVIAASAAYIVYKLITGVVIGTLKVICITLNALLGSKDSQDDDDKDFL